MSGFAFVRGTVIVKLHATKVGQRLGADEVVAIHAGPTVSFLKVHLRSLPQDALLYSGTAQAARAGLQRLLTLFVHVNDMHFGWYSCRRGGASSLFHETGSMETVLVTGRWANTRTARLYIQTGLAEVVALSLTLAQ